MEIDIRSILEELSFEALKKASKIKNIEIESRKKEDYIKELSDHPWVSDDFEKLIEIFKEDRENSVKAVLSYIFRSSDIINLSPKAIRSRLNEHAVDFKQEEINGFKVKESEESADEKLINFEYWYTKRVIILDDTGKILYFPVPTRTRFEMKPLDGIVMIYTISPGIALKCKNILETVLAIKAIPISPLEAE